MVPRSAYVARLLVDLARSVLQQRDYYSIRRRGRYAAAYQLIRNAIHARDRRALTERHRALSFDNVADEQMGRSLLREERVDEVPHVSENQQAGATVPVGEEVVHRGVLRPGCLCAVIEQEGVKDLRATQAEPRIVAGGSPANLVDLNCTCRSEGSDKPARHGDNRPLTRTPSCTRSSQSRHFRKRRWWRKESRPRAAGLGLENGRGPCGPVSHGRPRRRPRSAEKEALEGRKGDEEVLATAHGGCVRGESVAPLWCGRTSCLAFWAGDLFVRQGVITLRRGASRPHVRGGCVPRSVVSISGRARSIGPLLGSGCAGPSSFVMCRGRGGSLPWTAHAHRRTPSTRHVETRFLFRRSVPIRRPHESYRHGRRLLPSRNRIGCPNDLAATIRVSAPESQRLLMLSRADPSPPRSSSDGKSPTVLSINMTRGTDAALWQAWPWDETLPKLSYR
jgi:hypothetical protein